MDLTSLFNQFGQSSILNDVAQLDDTQKKILQEQLERLGPSISFPTLISKTEKQLPPLAECKTPTKHDFSRGQELIANAKAACILLAGGIGTRLGFEGPKGCFPITNIENKSLFQLFAEKLKAQQEQLGSELLAAIMVSSFNREEVLSFFEKHEYWGLSKNQILFFEQDNTPYFDNEGNWFWSKQGVLANSPNGNGYLFHCLRQSKVLQKLKNAGITYLQVVQVDNPLAAPLDPALIGFHAEHKCDVVIGAISRGAATEKTGLLTIENKKLKIAEYSEVPENLFKEVLPDHTFRYPYGNSGIHCFSIDFVETILQKESLKLPVHWVKKKTRRWTGSFFEDIWAWKVEHFIFDLLEYANNAKAVHLDRNDCYSPLKKQDGTQGIEEVKQALLEKDILTFESITGQKAKDHFFELSQEFHYPTPKLLKEWQGRSFPDSLYITP